jgi:putative salt-induced outer membrane protein
MLQYRKHDTITPGVHRAGRFSAIVLAAVLVTAGTAAAQENTEDAWSGSLGLSLVATSGNSDTQTLGLDLAVKKKPDPWGWEATATYLKSEQDGDTTAERYGGSLRGDRKLSERWALFSAVSAEHDAFAGYDLRGVLELGASYSALRGPVHELSLDAGLSWTTEDRIAGEDQDFMGGVFGLKYGWHPRKGTVVGQKLVWYPNFDQTSDWRLTSETTLQAALSERLALKFGYQVRYDHEPVPGFDETDTTTTVSIVVGF